MLSQHEQKIPWERCGRRVELRYDSQSVIGCAGATRPKAELEAKAGLQIDDSRSQCARSLAQVAAGDVDRQALPGVADAVGDARQRHRAFANPDLNMFGLALCVTLQRPTDLLCHVFHCL